jgi:prepilin-type N-terminal cleavage/methylation domain-containing protein
MKNKGFSLIELMAVIVIMGILMAMALVQFNNVVGRGRIKGAADRLSREIQGAREQAMSRGQTIDVVFSAGPSNSLRVTLNRIDTVVISTVLPPFTDCRLTLLTGVTRLPETGTGTPGSAVDFPSSTCRFTPQGVSTVGGVYITSTNGKYQYGIGVNANGRIRKSEWNGAWN